MKGRHWLVAGVIGFVLLSLTIALVLFVKSPVLMQPSGTVGVAQRDLFIAALAIMSLVAVPVFVLLFFIAWKYKATNTKATYNPTWESNRLLETIWWGIPICIVVILSLIAYQTSHSLDPFRALESDVKPLKVQVVAMQWKWLFIYPDYNTASVNELYIPVSTPVSFLITADAPMNSFWIPELGGQVYAMNGMKTALHLEASKTGEFKGLSSNISGEGFADMKFTVRSVENAAFLSVMKQKITDMPPLDMSQYESLATPSVVTEPQWFRLADPQLHQKVVDKYMLPMDSTDNYDSTDMNETQHGGSH